MPTNDQIILDLMLNEKRQAVAPEVSEADFFELFAAEQILKDRDLSYDEIQAGIVDGGGDGGIDAIYLFVNGELVREDTPPRSTRESVSIEVCVIQAKTGGGFTERALHRLCNTIDELFDLSRGPSEFKGVYNEGLLESIDRLRSTYTRHLLRMPELTLHFHYVTKADAVHPNVERLGAVVAQRVHEKLSSAECDFVFLGARELVQLTRRSPRRSYSLALAENPISTQNVGFICLVELSAYYRFITDDEDHTFNKGIFEANVRDYQGNVQVNRMIQDSLQNPREEDFWWLNNGITVVASRATLAGKTLTLETPQIVNGYQTSSEIHKYFQSKPDWRDERSVLVRIIVTENPGSLDRIILATNSQTSIKHESLRATDEIQRDIEDYLKPMGYYYDRKKNYYKNAGMPLRRIITIGYLGQAQMSIVLRRPDNARARPSTVISKKDEDYRRVFSKDYPLDLYLCSLEITNRATEYLREKGLSRNDVNNLRFHLAMFSALRLANNPAAGPVELAELDVSSLTPAFLDECYAIVDSEYKSLGGTDPVAKGPGLRDALIDNLKQLTHRGRLA